MSLTTITLSGTDYLSYCSVEKADEILAVDPTRNTNWAALEEDAKKIHLIAATNRIDLFRWLGRKTAESQTTDWPRSGLVYRDGGAAVDPNTIPPEIERATALAAGSTSLPSTTQSTQRTSAISVVKAGSAEVRFAVPQESAPQHPVETDEILALINEWLDRGTPNQDAEVGACASGTDAVSQFDDMDAFGYTGGLA